MRNPAAQRSRRLPLTHVAPRTPIAAVAALLCCGAAPNPDGAKPSPAEEALTRARIGEALMAEHRWDEAITQLSSATRLVPTWAFGRTLHAQARRARGLDHGPTLVELEAALELAPRSPRTLRELADVLYDLGRHREALATWEALAELTPRDARVHARMGQLALEVGDLPLARTHLRVASGLDPTDRISRSRLAEAYQLSHDADAAEAELRALARESPKDPWRWERLYRFLDLHGRTGDLDDVLSRWKAARKARAMKRRRLRPLRSPRRR